MQNQNLFLVSLILLFDIASFAAEFFPITATQSKDINPARYAIDKDVSTCSLAGVGSNSPDLGWLQIDLGNPFSVISVALTNTMNNYESHFLENFVVLVSKSNSTDVQSPNVCATFNNGSYVSPGSQINFTCSPNPLIGRYVTIKRQGGFRHDAISLCDVEVIRNPSDGYIYLYNLPTNQRGVYGDFVSSRAVDLDVESCAESVDTNNANGQWYIDLVKNYTITSVTIFNSKSGTPSYMSYFKITVGSTTDVNSQTLCYDYNKALPAGENDTITCATGSVGKYLSITRYGSDNTKALWLCEIYIKGQIFQEPSSSTSVSSPTSSITTTSSSTTTTTAKTTTISPIQVASSTTTSSTITSSTSTSLIPPASASPSSFAGFVSINTITATPASGPDGSSSSPGVTPNLTAIASEIEAKKKRDIMIICIVVIIGSILLLAAAGVVLFLCIRRKRSSQGLSTKSNHEQAIPMKPPVPPPKPKPGTLSNQVTTSDSRKETLRQPIRADSLVDYVARKISDQGGLKQEFEKLPKENKEHVTIGVRAGNSRRNRFKNIVPYDHTLVPLDVEDSDESDSNYINANYITGYQKTEKMYIASQGPKAETVVDFWRMIWQQNVDLIVMTTCICEAGKKKCEQYWPGKVGETKKFNKISVQLTLEDIYANHIYREMTVHDERKKNDQPRKVRHIQYLKWEDKTKPEHFLPILTFRKRVQVLQRNTSGPVVLHCSAGVGRTGTYIALDILLEQLNQEEQISFFSCVEKLRQQRMQMVQTWRQYQFLHEAVVDHYLTGETAIQCATFLRDFAELILPKPDGSKLEEQFKLLQKLKSQTKDKESAGTQQDNLSKNRNQDIIAYDEARLYLETNRHKENDYINAVYVDGYRSNETCILTQLPLKETIVDFWRMIWDYQLKAIVMLNEIESDDMDCPKYWPEDGDAETHGAIEVKATLTTEILPSVTLREFTVTHTNEKRKGPLTVRHYQVNDWQDNANEPRSPIPFLGLIGELTGISSKESIVIQCTDGATRSGLFAAAMYVIDMMKAEQVVDVFLACRFIAINRPQVISSQEQYKFLYQLASSYMNDMQDYSNCPPRLHPPTSNAHGVYANA